MIIVMFAPKGGTGKTTLSYYLSPYLPKDTQYLDLAKNADLSKKLVLDQPKPTRITKDYLNALLPRFYNDGVLVIDCGGYDSELSLLAMSKSDRIVFPMQQGFTNEDKPELLNSTLVQLSKQMDYKFTALTVWNSLHPNTNIQPLNELLSPYEHLEVLPWGIRQNAAIRDGKELKHPVVQDQLKRLAEVILNG